jgi:hypothetical protein
MQSILRKKRQPALLKSQWEVFQLVVGPFVLFSIAFMMLFLTPAVLDDEEMARWMKGVLAGLRVMGCLLSVVGLFGSYGYNSRRGYWAALLRYHNDVVCKRGEAPPPIIPSSPGVTWEPKKQVQ